MPMLEVDDIHTYYGNIHALKGISLTVDEGEIVTLIGANGAGKSTTLWTISGLLKPRQGRVLLEDEDLADYKAHEIVYKGVAMVPEGRRVFAKLTVAENLDMGAYHRSDRMLATGRAVMARPRLLLMDEPSMGLAPVLVESVFETIESINRDGTTILLVEQNAHMALQVADRGYVLQTGEIVLSDTAEGLRKNPMVQKAYLGID